MRLYLVHHGEAVPPGVDPQRPLSEGGSASVEQVAEKAAMQGAKPAVVWHSGKLRARQTAEAFWRACNALADMWVANYYSAPQSVEIIKFGDPGGGR